MVEIFQTKQYQPEEAEGPLGPAEVLARADVEFNVRKLIEVDPEIQDLAQRAISAVWQLHMQEPTTANLRFCKEIELRIPGGGTESVNALYQTETNTINLAMETLKQRHPELPFGNIVVMHAGHEARHMVQVAIGDTPPDSNQSMSEGTYWDSRHEVEAAESSLEALSAIYPDQWFNFQLGSRVYTNKRPNNT